MLHALLEQDPEAIVRWLAGRTAWWIRRHQASLAALGPIAWHWLGRAEASLHALKPAASPAGPVTRPPILARGTGKAAVR